ncbi:hypothetical protein K2W90_05725 [Candidatus Babeliales bacterium]|nr:hypothetical protein [Candidatus Babeliales bacterium]
MEHRNWPTLGLALFAALGLWFMLDNLGMASAKGMFWSWFVLFLGISKLSCHMECSKKEKCGPWNPKILCGAVLTVVGAWFLLGDLGHVPTYGLNLLFVLTFAVPAAALAERFLWTK